MQTQSHPCWKCKTDQEILSSRTVGGMSIALCTGCVDDLIIGQFKLEPNALGMKFGKE